jgi:hypothetical protein
MTRRVPAAAGVALALAAATPALGADAGRSFPTLPMRAATQQGGFRGTLEVQRFAAAGTDIVAGGRLQGRLRDRRYPSEQRIDQDIRTVVRLTPPPAGARDCARLRLTFAGRTLKLFGLRAAMAPRIATLRPRGRAAQAMREVLCATTQLLNATPPQGAPAPGSPPQGTPTPAPPPAWLLHLLNALRALA